MRRALFSLFLISLLTTVLGPYATAQMHHDHHEAGAMTKAECDEVVCPVTNRVMKKGETQVSYSLYFASEDAREAFLKDPVKFLTATCPVMGGEANKLTAPYSNYDGVAYYHCCAGCREMFQKEPQKYIGQSPKKSEMDSRSEVMGKSATASAAMCAARSQGCSRTNIEKNLRGQTCGMSQSSDAPAYSAVQAEGTAFTDPVCGMIISSQDCVQAEHKGVEYCFCSDHCKEKFDKEPEKFINK